MPERTLRFQHKLWQIINSCQSGAVVWSDLGDSIIFRFSQFKKEYLDRNTNFCKSNKIASFVRQLNLYGFRKLVKTGLAKKRLQDLHEFQNPFFQRGRKDLLENVVRSSTTPTIWKRSPFSTENTSKRSSRRGKRGRGKRKIKCKKTELEDVDHCYGKLGSNQYPEDQKSVLWSKDLSSTKYFPRDISNFESKTSVITKAGQPASQIHNSIQSMTENYERIKIIENANNCMIKSASSPIRKNEDFEFKNTIPHFETKPIFQTQSEANFAYLEDDFLLVSDKDDYDDEFYNTLMEDEETLTYLNEPILFGEKEISGADLKSSSIKFCSCDDCEISEEYLELVSTNARMRSTVRPLFYCVCNSGIPPKWMLTAFPP